MTHLPSLIQDLGFILITAAIVTLLFRKLKQPVVLGYLIAGFLVGPHVPQIPTVVDENSIKVWAEIGVIFLLFGLGLEFSFKKLAQVGKTASITAICEIVFMLMAGYVTGKFLGWKEMDSLFLGGILSISSTTIIVRAFDELGLKGKKFVSLVFGILIVEDLIAILLLVLLSTVAVTQTLSGTELLFTSMRLVFFLALWFVIGIYAVPIFLKKVRSLLTDETTLVVAIGLCLFMVIIATKVGFSPALGAFVMGSILAETTQGKKIEHLLMPVRDLFAAIFFVSVGMLIDPGILGKYFWIIMLLTAVTIFGKLLSTSLGALLSGQNLKNSVQTGMSLAQIGEFSFIIATLGMSLNVTSDFLYPIAVAVSAITTFTTPYQIKYSDQFYQYLEKRLPRGLQNRLAEYHEATSRKSAANAFSLLWEAFGIKIVLNFTMVLAITMGAKKFILPYAFIRFDESPLISIAVGLVTLVLALPFLGAIAFGKARRVELSQIELLLLQKLQIGFAIGRFLFSMMLLAFLVAQFAPGEVIYGLVLFSLAVLLLFFGKFAEPTYIFFEKKFLSNLQEKEFDTLSKPMPALAPWDAILSEFIISPYSELIGLSLQNSKLKERFGVTIALIERGEKRILAPGRNDLLLPYDRLFLIGTDDQLNEAREIIEKKNLQTDDFDEEQYGLEAVLLNEKSPFIHKTIRECGLRETIHGLIVGLERDGKRILSPDSNLILSPGDLIWLVGDRTLIKKFSN